MLSEEVATALDGADGGAEGSSAFCLEFVNVNASSQAEKQRNQKVIRSTAMKHFRRRQQSQRTQVKGKNSMTSQVRPQRLPQRLKEPPKSKEEGGTVFGAQHKETKWKRSQHPQAISSQVVRDWPFQSTLSETYYESEVFINDNYSVPRYSKAFQVDRSHNDQTSNEIFFMGSPMTLLGGGRVDPFRNYPVENVSSHFHELIDHSISFLWPGLRPRGSDGYENRISSAWLEKVTSRPVVMHAMLFGAAVHVDVLRSPRINLNNPTRLFHKVQTMRLLKEELKRPVISDPDELILAVLTLGANEIETMMDNMKPKTRSPFNSPLSSTQWLDVYGSMSHIKAHTLAVQSLVDRRGGLEKIELEGLAEVLEFSDILGATQSLSKPHWPLLERTARSYTSHNSGLLYCPLKNIGQGFQALKVFGISNNIAYVLQGLADLTIVLERYSRGIAPIPDLAMVIDRRNFVQHALVSLPTADELEAGEVGGVHLYESIRYTAMIYSIAVTFPLPPMTGIYEKLTTLLKSILEESKFDICWKLFPKTLLWSLTFGGIAASITPSRTWFVHNLAAVSAALNLSRWEDIVEEMGNYLWLERACDAGGRKLWLEVSRERCLDSDFAQDDE